MIPPDLKAQGMAAMDFIFDFFKRENKVTFYKSASEVIISNDPEWNSDFGDSYSNNIVKTVEKAEFECRIWYVKNAPELKFVDGTENVSLAVAYPKGKVKIQMRRDAFDWLNEVKSFWVEGEKYDNVTDKRRIGIFGEYQFYEITLEKNQ